MTKPSLFCGLLIASGSLFAQQYTINTIAGIATSPGWSGDSGPATSAQINTPLRVVLDPAGNIYINDWFNNSIRVVSPANGQMNSLTGNGLPGYSGDGGSSIGAQLAGPHDIALDASGNLYIADTGNLRVRVVSTSKSTISTFAGNGTRGTVSDNNGNGNKGAAKSAQFIIPTGVAVDKSGNVYISDIGNASVRKVTPDGTITAFAGVGFLSFGTYAGEGGPATSALLGQPYSLTTDSAGNVYIVDIGLSRLFRVGADGNIHTVATNFTGQNAVIDAAGNIYEADPAHNVVRKILPNGSNLWIGGDGVSGWSGDTGVGTSAQMAQPYGVAVDASGNVFVAEATNAIVRELTPVPLSIGGIANAATSQPFQSAASGSGDASIAVSAGEIVTIFGTGMGPAKLTSAAALQPNGTVGTSLAGTSVTFAGTPAPILYTSDSFVSVIVPYAVNGLTSANVVVTYQGNPLHSYTVPIANTAPGVFTLDSTGSGQALAINFSDNTLNSASNPVVAGNYVTLYATGEGQTTPAGVDGKATPVYLADGTTPAPHIVPLQTVSATVGGAAAVTAGVEAPTFVAGLMQVNVQVPADARSGPNEVRLTAGSLISPPVTIYVK